MSITRAIISLMWWQPTPRIFSLWILLALWSGCSGRVEGTIAGDCDDAADNDGDGLFDCDDPTCTGSPLCHRTDGGLDGGEPDASASDAGDPLDANALDAASTDGAAPDGDAWFESDGAVSHADAGGCPLGADSDGDGLTDDFEGAADSDGDGLGNLLDLDSDGDGATDSDESGALGGCSARNTDAPDDALPDYLDNDSDGDGLSDREERETFLTDPLDPDTDHDLFTDLDEVATGHDPRDAADTILPADHYVVLEHGSPFEERDLIFDTAIQQADVFFLMDRTGSMTGEVDRFKSSLSTIVPFMRAQIPNLGVGFGGFAGFGGPAGSGGSCTIILGVESCDDGPAGDLPFHLYGAITTDLAQMQSDLNMFEADQGGATWASSNEALYQAATGDGISPWVVARTCPAVPGETGSRYGYPCFRPGSLPIAIVMTDTSSKNGPLTEGVSGATYDPARFPGPDPHTYIQTRDALLRIGARVFGVLSGAEVSNPTPQQQFEVWARETGTVDAGGTPIVFNIAGDGSGLDTSIVEAIRVLAQETPQTISALVRDGEDVPATVGPVDASRFIETITPRRVFESGVPTVTCPLAARCDAARFYGVTPGDTVELRIRFQNDFQVAVSSAQLFRASIVVVGNAVAELDRQEVVIAVPASSLPIPR